ncbi:hypothetical protein [Phthorimaea operculella granulovirus]|uniref:Acetyltransferase n=1 Tax=Phthorimaea operculella granulovirus TaxID=192584 RepID=Q8JS00_9BBAC|nr:hypothetical protein [Phthorimaea operculella granulovirus]AAM70257.1 unknown [Phthorimaea operculella granulovirus]ANY57448.1 hypothetical protein PhopGVgp059 [Phthorimaea operculella granulovirus]QBH65894.1 hypothetical protein PhopGVgp059 [Phthorimaea operculella granulovirus]QBH66024.1 hypothetical protein PhopGVgp059 [Phthorimaea operculella granulovirus]QBH66154.1 hypothetical protein PhopGVgp059 [Phthorimaea operculella granulovirus]
MMDVPTLVPFGQIQYKSTHHHYCGFYSLTVLAEIVDNTVVVNGKLYTVSDETAIDWAYDGIDTIISEKRLVYTNNVWPLNAPIYNIEHQIVGIVTRGIETTDGDNCYAVQDGFRLLNIHLSNVNLLVREKRKPIVYADQQFDTKQELNVYLTKNKSADSKYGAIMYHTNKLNAQLVLFAKGHQISNIHLRKKIFGAL